MINDDHHDYDDQAFCTTEMIESYAAIETGTLPELSAQQVKIFLSVILSYIVTQ